MCLPPGSTIYRKHKDFGKCCYDITLEPSIDIPTSYLHGKIRTKIQESVSRSNTFRKDTPCDMLDRHAPSDTTRIRELKVKYEKLKSSMPKRESLDDWLQRWEVTFTECLDYNISDVQENGAVWDFVRATD
jgi:hypothetical protein